jgi:hypothetical protein
MNADLLFLFNLSIENFISGQCVVPIRGFAVRPKRRSTFLAGLSSDGSRINPAPFSLAGEPHGAPALPPTSLKIHETGF